MFVCIPIYLQYYIPHITAGDLFVDLESLSILSKTCLH